jgi:hypothetical protein
MKVIIHIIDTVILSSCGQDDQIISCHSGDSTMIQHGGRNGSKRKREAGVQDKEEKSEMIAQWKRDGPITC